MSTFDKENFVTGKRATAVALAAYKAVKADSTEHLVEIAGAGASIVGFTRSAAAASALVELAGHGGGALATAGGNISDGDLLKVDANGDLVVASTAGDLAVAIARADAVDNDVFPIFVENTRIHA